ncbi:MAG: hypothetical protein PHW95_01085 [Patescibacteria group bacterium]|nr:hypothetical protein [Patescibacteria group bacterium]
MEYLEAKINQLVVETAGNSKNFVRTFTTKPNRDLLNSRGKIFGLIEIQSTHEKIPDLIDFIIDEIKNNFYDNKSAAEVEPLSLSELFELVLKKTNLAIASFIESEQITLDLDKINIIIAVVRNQDIHFTTVGKMGVILFYSSAKNTFRIINVGEDSQIGLETPDPLKMFAQVISGRVRPRDVLLVSTTNTFDYFSFERLKNIITASNPTEGVMQLKQLLEQINNQENFAVMAVELEKRVIVPKEPTVSIDRINYQEAASKDSIKELMNTERETEKLLTPSLLPEVKKYLASFKKATQNYLSRVRGNTNPINSLRNKSFKPKIKLPNISLPLPKIKPGVFADMQHRLRSLTSPAKTNFSKLSSGLAKIPFYTLSSRILTKMFSGLYFRFKHLPKSSQYLLVSIIILVIVFSQSIIWIGVKNNYDKKVMSFDKIIDDVSNKKNDAESSLIYRDENQARQLLIDAKNLLAANQAITDTQKKSAADLATEIQTELEKLQHLVTINDPIQILNIQNLDPNGSLSSAAVQMGREIYDQNSNDKQIYKISIDGRIGSQVSSGNQGQGTFTAAVVGQNNEIIFVDDHKKFFKFSAKDGKLTATDINYAPDININDLGYFNGRLYILSENKRQIYRFRPSGSGFVADSEWYKDDSTKIAGATALTVDGAVYILKNDGQVLKLENGVVQGFKVGAIDPPMSNPTKIKIPDGSKFIYVLDPTNNRLVIFDKQGKLINQYRSESFTNLKDFSVDEKNKKAYAISGSTVYGVPLEHL